MGTTYPIRHPKTRNRDTRPFAFGQLGKASNGGGTGIIGAVISSISSGTPNATDATITWTTNIPTTSKVYWGLTTAYAGASSPIFDGTLVTSHSVQITGLITATTYHYKVESGGPGVGITVSADGTFITA